MQFFLYPTSIVNWFHEVNAQVWALTDEITTLQYTRFIQPHLNSIKSLQTFQNRTTEESLTEVSFKDLVNFRFDIIPLYPSIWLHGTAISITA